MLELDRSTRFGQIGEHSYLESVCLGQEIIIAKMSRFQWIRSGDLPEYHQWRNKARGKES
jgi:hypothetical protein